jgi:hypothetical protein
VQVSAEAKDQIRLLVFGVGTALVALVCTWAVLVLIPERSRDNVPWKWVRLAVVSTVFIVYCLKTYWQARKDWHFWLILLGVFVIHFAGMGYLFYRGEGLPLMFFGPAVALEWTLLAVILHHVLGIAPKLR